MTNFRGCNFAVALINSVCPLNMLFLLSLVWKHGTWRPEGPRGLQKVLDRGAISRFWGDGVRWAKVVHVCHAAFLLTDAQLRAQCAEMSEFAVLQSPIHAPKPPTHSSGAPPIVWSGLGRLPAVFAPRPITEVYNCVSRAGGQQWVTTWVTHGVCVPAWLILKIVLALSHLKIALQPRPWRSALKSVLCFQLSRAWKLWRIFACKYFWVCVETETFRPPCIICLPC